MTKDVEKYNIEKIEEFNRIKNICLKLRRLGELNEDNLTKLFKRDLFFLNDYYCKRFFSNDKRDIRIRCLIETSLYKSMRNENSEYRLRNVDTGFINIEKESFLTFYLNNINKGCNSLINKFFHVLVKMKISRGDYKRFLAMYLIFKYKNLSLNKIDNILLSEEERKSLKYLLSGKTKSLRYLDFDASLIRMVKAVEGYINISETTIYDDDMLRKMLRVRASTINVAKDLGCSEIIKDIFDAKVKYFKSNFISGSDLRKTKQFNFKSLIVQNTIFIKSELDNWYVDVDKRTRQAILYHGNDGNTDIYHYQKTFNGINMFRVYKYIHEHDEYCLRRYKKVDRAKRNKGA